MPKAYWEELVEAVANMFFYLFAFFIVILPPLVWLDRVFSGREGLWWVLAAIVVFVFLLPMAVEAFLPWFLNVFERIKRGELVRPLFVPLRAASSVLAIYGVLKLEYFVMHAKPEAAETSWPDIIWQFLTAL